MGSQCIRTLINGSPVFLVHGGLTSRRGWTARVQARIDREKKVRKEKAAREKAAKSDGAGEGSSSGVKGA